MTPLYPAVPVPPISGSEQGRTSGMIAAVLCLVVAALTVTCSFLPLFSGELRVMGRSLEMVVTSWGFRLSPGGTKEGAVAINGVPLTVAAVLLLGAAATGLVAASRASAGRGRRVVGLLTVVGAAFLSGTVWTVGMQVTSMLGSFRPTGGGSDVEAVAYIGVGFWILLAAAVLSILAAVLAFPRRGRTEQLPGAPLWQYPLVPVQLGNEPTPYQPLQQDQQYQAYSGPMPETTTQQPRPAPTDPPSPTSG